MRRDLLIAFALFAVALAYNLAHVDSTAFHRDEARWIHRARFVPQLADPLGPYWHDRDLTRGQPPLGSYLMGVGLVLQDRDTDTNGLWNFRKSDAWNQWHGRMPTREDLTAARRTDSVVGALIAVCAFVVGRRLRGRVAGVVAALLVIPHPLSVYLSSLAGSDALLTLLVALAAVAAVALADRPTWPRAALLGVLLGLGGATKLSPLLLSVPLAGLGALLLLTRWRRPALVAAPSRLGWQLLALPPVALAAFVAAYPYLWPDPIGRTLNLFLFRAQEMESQGEIWGNLAVSGPVDAMSRVGRWLAEVNSTTGWLGHTFAGWFGREWNPVGIDLALGLAGALVLAATVARRGLFGRHALAAAVLGGQVAAIVLGMRADFERYLYPVLFAVAVCGGIAVAAAWDGLRALLARRRVSPRAATSAAMALPAAGASRLGPAIPAQSRALARRLAARRAPAPASAKPALLARARPRVEVTPKTKPAAARRSLPPRPSPARPAVAANDHAPAAPRERVGAGALRGDATA